MVLKWLGHACFYLELSQTSVVLDPYAEGLGYPELNISAKIVTISHNHFDHNNYQVVRGNPQIITAPERTVIDGLVFYGIPVYHDLEQGSQRGKNIIFVLEGEGLKIAHLGDLGHGLSAEIIEKMRGLDLLLIPVGGVYTIGPETACEITKSVQAKVTIPMHYKTKHLKFNLESVDNYLKYFDPLKIKHINQSEITITSDFLVDITEEIWVMNY